MYLEPKERVWWLHVILPPPLRGANSVLLNPLAGFEGPLHGEGKKEGKGKEGMDVNDGRKCLPGFVYTNTVSGKKETKVFSVILWCVGWVGG